MSSEGLKVIIVGAGFCGMVAAIECKLAGMNPVLVETYPTSRTQGDVIDFFPNGGRIIESWDNGRVSKKLLDICINNCERFNFWSHDGQFLVDDAWLQEPHHFDSQFAGHRGEMHQVMIDYAVEIGVEFQFRETVVEYLDSETELGVLTKSGKKFLGDVVLAADGPRSLARAQVLGLPDNKVNSGYAIYRAFYNLTEEHKKDPLMKEFVNPEKDTTAMWVGRDLHALVYSWNKGRDLTWVLTHKDDHDIGESWSFPGEKADVIKYLDDGKFEERLKAVVNYTPNKSLIDYKLVWREPLKTWLPKSARILVMGDAAHCHLPTSGQGGSQSIEDGASIAVCLRRAKGDIKLALRAFERIRYNRAHVIHMSSVSNRNEYHNVEWTPQFVKDHPGSLSLRRPEWIIAHDAKQFAEENFDKVAEDIKTGKKGTLKELSLPAEGQIMEVDAHGNEKAVNVEIETIEVEVN